MKNNFAATFILLAVGLVFNDVASVHGKPTKRNPNGWKGWQIERIRAEGTGAIYRCHGTYDDYKYPQECNRAERIKDTLVDFCNEGDPISCNILSSMQQAEINAFNVEGAKMVKEVAGES